MSKTNQKSSLDVMGMHCASCASIIKRTVEKLDGVESCEVNVGTEKAQLSYDPEKVSVSDMNHAIGKLGYSLVEKETAQPAMEMDHPMDHSMHAGHDMMIPISSDKSVKERKLQELKKLEQHIKIVTPFILVSIFVMIWEVGASPFGLWPEMPQLFKDFFHHLLPIFATYTLFVIGVPYLQGVVRFIKYKVANMDTLVGIGTLVAFYYSFFLSAFETQLAPFINTEHTY